MATTDDTASAAMIPDVIHAGVYEHYKGEMYLVLGLAHHSETLEKFMVYVPLYVREGPRMCVRPADMFFDDVCVECMARFGSYEVNRCVVLRHSQTSRRPRFKYVGTEVSV